MEKYVKIKKLGEGSYGIVYEALNKLTGEVVAIKKLKTKCTSKEECKNQIEVKALQKIKHPNIVKLKEINGENGNVFLVFECMECSLYDRLNNIRMVSFSESEIKNLCFQLFQGLAHMHGNGYFHRDLKPDNLLLSKDHGIIKIADLGQARETDGEPPYTDYVTTRCYRAPEVFLHSSVYDPAVDMWAMGAIMAELFIHRPLFRGDSGGEVLYKICSVIGSPTESKWSEGLQLARNMNYRFPDHPGMPLASLLPSASSEALCLIATLLSWNPCLRPTATEALEHPFFDDVTPPIHVNKDLPWKRALLKPARSSKI
ncbi:unnamed protein product [Lactuca saligna]|uniref:Protein kinase domain-containing protein n=1 Tax=Lactuca saligna TaxID=75948 RepID=A0AA36E9A1_LACSI|nr:unnamed protein product [Lactuca saligna]